MLCFTYIHAYSAICGLFQEPSDPMIARDVLHRNIDKIVETTSRVEETLAMKLYKY